MRRSPLLLGLIPALPVLVAVGACAEAPVSIGLVLKAPLGLLDDARSITLSVADAKGTSCDANTGQVTGMPSGSGVQTFDLQQAGCPAGSWCKQIELDQSDAPRLFAIVAKGEGGVTIGQGCTQRAVDQDPLAVAITLRRFNDPPCCGNGEIEAGETCDTGAAAQMACGELAPGGACSGIVATGSCGCDCSSEEVLVSSDNAFVSPPLKNDPPGSKREPAITFAQGLHAVFVNDIQGLGDVHSRVLNEDLEQISDPVLGLQLRMPVLCTDPDASGSLGYNQETPAIATAGARVAIVYASDQDYPNVSEIYFNAQNPNGCADEGPTKLTDGGMDSTKAASVPDVAGGPQGKALVTWQRTKAGGIFGRIVDIATQAPIGAEFPLGEGVSEAKNARVAGNTERWVVVYEGQNDDVYRQFVLPDGKPELGVRVNLGDTDGKQDQPDVAMLPGGQFIVVWHDAKGDEIRFQRVNAEGVNVAGDQDQPLHEASPDTLQQRPVVASGQGFFAVAWEDVEGTISARYLDAESGFRFNAVTGQNTPFLASRADIANGLRSAPAIAIGSKNVAIGWQANGTEHYGIYVRRFPLPLDL